MLLHKYISYIILSGLYPVIQKSYQDIRYKHDSNTKPRTEFQSFAWPVSYIYAFYPFISYSTLQVLKSGRGVNYSSVLEMPIPGT